jgi:hypothetical protein
VKLSVSPESVLVSVKERATVSDGLVSESEAVGEYVLLRTEERETEIVSVKKFEKVEVEDPVGVCNAVGLMTRDTVLESDGEHCVSVTVPVVPETDRERCSLGVAVVRSTDTEGVREISDRLTVMVRRALTVGENDSEREAEALKLVVNVGVGATVTVD